MIMEILRFSTWKLIASVGIQTWKMVFADWSSTGRTLPRTNSLQWPLSPSSMSLTSRHTIRRRVTLLMTSWPTNQQYGVLGIFHKTETSSQLWAETAPSTFGSTTIQLTDQSRTKTDWKWEWQEELSYWTRRCWHNSQLLGSTGTRTNSASHALAHWTKNVQ
jgi:hypothetical protein